MPPSMKVLLKGTRLLSRAAVGTDSFQMAGNYLLNFGGGGDEPMGFSKWMGFYERYQVFSSKFIAKIHNDTQNGLIVAVYPSDGSVSVTAVEDAKAQKYGKWTTVFANEALGMGKLTSYMSNRKLQGTYVTDRDYQGTITQDPDNKWWWQFMAQNTDSSNPDYTLQITMYYYVKFFQLANDDQPS